MSYQNVSPVDAMNILKARERLGRIESSRQLRTVEGLRYFSYRNLRDFVVYSPQEMTGDSALPVSGYAQTRYYETPFPPMTTRSAASPAARPAAGTPSTRSRSTGPAG